MPDNNDLHNNVWPTIKFGLQNGPAYCEAFLNVLRNVTKEEAVQYVLALIDDMLSGIQCKPWTSFYMHSFLMSSVQHHNIKDLCVCS